MREMAENYNFQKYTYIIQLICPSVLYLKYPDFIIQICKKASILEELFFYFFHLMISPLVYFPFVQIL